MTAQCAPYMGAMKNFWTPWLRPRLFSPKFSWAFVPIDHVNIPTKFSFSCSWVNSLGVDKKFWAVPGYAHTLSPSKKILYALVSSYKPCIHIIRVSARVCAKFYIAVLSVVANPQSWERRGRKESRMVPFERTLVSSYRPSIVTFPLSLRFS